MGKTPIAKVEMELRPFQVPNYARVSRLGPESEGIPVGQLPAKALDDAAERWLNELYEKCGEDSPFTREFRDPDGNIILAGSVG